MNITAVPFMEGFIRMCNDGWRQGWHERNGGNLSYRIKKEEIDFVKEFLKTDGEWKAIGTSVPKLAGEYFLVTGSGKFFRNVILDPADSIAIIELDEKGENYRICWGLENGGRPTSELPSHLMNHEVKMIASSGRHRVIYHAHPVNVIALTFVLPLKDEVFTRELWEMATECPVVFPDGIGVVGWMVPGGREIAVATSELMKQYDVAIWAHHGMFCSGEDFNLTFGLMHTVEKAAEILVKVLSMRPDKLQTITAQNFRDLAVDFKVTLPEKFLYEKQFTIRSATHNDLPVILTIYAHAREFQKQTGNPNQWKNGYPYRDVLEDDIADGNLYVCMAGEKIVGVFAFILGEDPTYLKIWDGAWINDEPYGTIHRIASDGSVRGIAAFCFAWAYEKSGENLRIDTHEDNTVMQHILAKNGFSYCGKILTDDGTERLAYQKCKKI